MDEILKGTSRAFYLSLAVLPKGARSTLSLAYLLARAADTIADAPAGSGVDQLALLSSLRQAVVKPEPSGWNPSEKDWEMLNLALPEGSADRRLVGATHQLLELLRERPEEEEQPIRDVVGTLIEGMIWDQSLFTRENPGRASSGLDDAELERYTYLVAGCVGPFWSQVCALSDPRLRHLPGDHELAVEFGKGLQWVNILRDIPEDHRQGRYYLPGLDEAGFPQRFRGRCRRALEALTAAQRYPLLFPSSYLRHRMAVFWPLVLALRTMEKLLRAGGPRPGRRVKVARWEVLAWVGLSPLLVVSDRLLSTVLSTLQHRAERALMTLEDNDATKD